MKEVYPNLFVGDENDYRENAKTMEGWFIVHACKEPYHRQALGYTGKAAPKYDPEYLWAERENRLILNLVDAPDPRYIPKEIIDKALAYIDQYLESGKKVLVHCNQGRSRSGGLALLYLLSKNVLSGETIEEVSQNFASQHYPPYAPAGGISGFLKQNWQEYQGTFDNK